MASRLNLHEEFCEILNSRNAYFQPPASVRMSYPCIRYKRSAPGVVYADNKAYKCDNRYEGVIIDRDPDSVLPDLVLKRFESCSIGTPYPADNLYHYPFTIYY